MNLDKKSLSIIEYFYPLEKEIRSSLKDYQCKGTHLQNYLYFNFEPMFNYTDAIIVLCSSGKYTAASSLLRSVLELHFNVIYHQVGDSEKRLAISAKDHFDQLKRIFSSVLDFIKRYPEQSSSDPRDLFNLSYLENALGRIKVVQENIALSNSINQDDKKPYLIDIVKKCDKAEIKNTAKGYFEKLYHLIYRQLSFSVHLDVLGLESFVDKDAEGKYIVKESNKPEIIIPHAIAICVVFVKDLYENGVLKGKISALVYKIEELLK